MKNIGNFLFCLEIKSGQFGESNRHKKKQKPKRHNKIYEKLD